MQRLFIRQVYSKLINYIKLTDEEVLMDLIIFLIITFGNFTVSISLFLGLVTLYP